MAGKITRNGPFAGSTGACTGKTSVRTSENDLANISSPVTSNFTKFSCGPGRLGCSNDVPALPVVVLRRVIGLSHKTKNAKCKSANCRARRTHWLGVDMHCWASSPAGSALSASSLVGSQTGDCGFRNEVALGVSSVLGRLDVLGVLRLDDGEIKNIYIYAREWTL